ncbi:MAG: hypothetical protein ABSB87_13265 [Terriglobales bacterium]|jgi:hypothetical protein
MGLSQAAPFFEPGEGETELNLTLALPDALHNELEEAARDCQLTAKDFVAECVQAILAERRLPHVYVPLLTQGAQHRGPRGAGRKHQGERETEMVLTEHRIVFPELNGGEI